MLVVVRAMMMSIKFMIEGLHRVIILLVEPRLDSMRTCKFESVRARLVHLILFVKVKAWLLNLLKFVHMASMLASLPAAILVIAVSCLWVESKLRITLFVFLVFLSLHCWMCFD